MSAQRRTRPKPTGRPTMWGVGLVLGALIFTACTGDPGDSQDHNEEAHAAAEEYAAELVAFADTVRDAVDGWDPVEDDSTEVEALAEQAPTLDEHDDVDGTPLYLAAQRAQDTVQTSVAEIAIYAELDADFETLSAHVSDRAADSNEASRPYEDAIYDAVSDSEPGEFNPAVVEAWRNYAEYYLENSQETLEVELGIYGDDPLARSFAAFAEEQREFGHREIERAISYFDTVDEPAVTVYTSLLNSSSAYFLIGDWFRVDHAPTIVEALADQVEQTAGVLADDGDPAEVPRRGDAYRSLIADVFILPGEDYFEDIRALNVSQWLTWRIGELEDIEAEEVREVIDTISLQSPASLSEDHTPFPSAENYFGIVMIMNRDIGGSGVSEDNRAKARSVVAWARLYVDERPPPPVIAEDVLTIVEAGESFIADLEAYVEENPDASLGELLDGFSDPLNDTVDAAATRIARFLDDDEALSAAIAEALDAMGT